METIKANLSQPYTLPSRSKSQHTDRPRRIKHENLICISNGGGSSKYQGLWLASTSFRFDNEVFRIPPLLIHLTLLPMLNEHLRYNQGNCNILVK